MRSGGHRAPGAGRNIGATQAAKDELRKDYFWRGEFVTYVGCAPVGFDVHALACRNDSVWYR